MSIFVHSTKLSPAWTTILQNHILSFSLTCTLIYMITHTLAQGNIFLTIFVSLRKRESHPFLPTILIYGLWVRNNRVLPSYSSRLMKQIRRSPFAMSNCQISRQIYRIVTSFWNLNFVLYLAVRVIHPTFCVLLYLKSQFHSVLAYIFLQKGIFLTRKTVQNMHLLK